MNKKINEELRVCDIILSMEIPFKISQLFEKAESQGVYDKMLILEVLNQLCDSGVIKYSEVGDDVWAYKKIAQRLRML